MLSFRTMFEGRRAKDLEARIAFAIPPETYVAEIGAGRIRTRRGEPAGADLVLSGPATAIAAAVYGGVPLEALEADAALRVEGDRELAARFVTLFPLPPKFAPPA
jgi:SCP-2 sterol transfer family protein